MESQLAVSFTGRRFRRLLAPAAALALLAAAGIGFQALSVSAAQAPAQAQPARSEPEELPAPEEVPAQAARPVAEGEVTPKQEAKAAGAVESGGNQVAADCASLQKLATDLKAEVDKTTKEELSVSVVRKAEGIEQLARKVRGKKGN